MKPREDPYDHRPYRPRLPLRNTTSWATGTSPPTPTGGVHTLRAVENFPITGQPLSSNMYLVRGLAAVKLAAARTNHELGLLDAERARAIEDACADVMNGKLHDHFVVDMMQGGAGTSAEHERQ